MGLFRCQDTENCISFRNMCTKKAARKLVFPLPFFRYSTNRFSQEAVNRFPSHSTYSPGLISTPVASKSVY